MNLMFMFGLQDLPVHSNSGQLMLPMLYARTKNGNVKWYEIIVVHDKKHSEICTKKASKIGGKAQIDIEKITSGVNVGKANETTIAQQALAEAMSLFNRLKDKGYKTLSDLGVTIKDRGYVAGGVRYKTITEAVLSVCEHNTDASGRMKPMLASGYNEAWVKFPCTMQPKYNGVRCLVERTEKEVILTSRNGKRYFIKRVEAFYMKKLKPGQKTDGELYSLELTFQEIISAVKRQNEVHPEQDKIFHVVYDIPTDGDWFARNKAIKALKLKMLEKGNTHPVVESPSFSCPDLSEVPALHKKIVALGYGGEERGSIIRNSCGLYEFGNRSHNLIKHKEMMDAEFVVVDVMQATGRDKGTAVFVCKAPKAKTETKLFNIRPEGDRELRARYYKERKKLIGKKLTVRFQNYSDAGIPIFPVGVAIRDYE